MRKIYLILKLETIIIVEEGIPVFKIIEELNKNLILYSDIIDIEDTQITDYQIIDSK